MDRRLETHTDPLSVHTVPVFQKDLAAVFKLLAERNQDSATALTMPTALPAQDSAWTEDHVRALFTRCKPVHRAILTRMAEASSSGESATYEELRAAGAQASGSPDFDFDNMRGNLAWISKYMIKITGATIGLYTVTDRGAVLGTGSRYEYRMTKPIADAWLRINQTA
jgi:hypothetical protein